MRLYFLYHQEIIDETTLREDEQNEEAQPKSKRITQLPSVVERLPDASEFESDRTSVKGSPAHKLFVPRKRTISFRHKINNQNNDDSSRYAVKVPRKSLVSKYKGRRNTSQRRAITYTGTKPIPVSCKIAYEIWSMVL